MTLLFVGCSGDRLYFIMSAWNAYNTYLISCRLFEE